MLILALLRKSFNKKKSGYLEASTKREYKL